MISDPGTEPWLAFQTLIDDSDRSRAEWFEQLVDVASAGTVSASTEFAFAMVRRSPGPDRAALLRFDGDMIDICAATIEIETEARVYADRAFIGALGVPGVVGPPGPVGGSILFEKLDVAVGAVLPVQFDGTVRGAFVIGHSRPPANDPTTLTVSMLESLCSTLGMVMQREESVQRLEESKRRLEAYVYTAAHDLRSPLRRIRSFSQLLQTRLDVEEIDRAQVSDFADRIANGAERLDALLETMLDDATTSATASGSTDVDPLRSR